MMQHLKILQNHFIIGNQKDNNFRSRAIFGVEKKHKLAPSEDRGQHPSKNALQRDYYVDVQRVTPSMNHNIRRENH
jgi:predicted RNA-binding protein associated with RNAse of E/G family